MDISLFLNQYRYGFYLEVGDTSHDGNCVAVSIFLLSTHSKKDVLNAFNTSDTKNELEFLTEFSSNNREKKNLYYSKQCYQKLMSLGLMDDCLDFGKPFSYEEYVDSCDSVDCFSYAKMYMNLVKLALPYLDYRMILPNHYDNSIDLKGDLLTNSSF